MSQSLLPTAAEAAWFNVAQWVETAGGLQPWRVRPELAATAYSADFTAQASAAAGVRVEIETDAEALEIALSPPPASEQERLTVDVVFDNKLHARFALEHGHRTTRQTIPLPGRPGRLEVWLPHESGVVLNEIAVRGGSAWQPVAPRPKWLTYGSSITHCIEADGPAQTWPALVARRLGVEVYALGLAGQCHLDYAIERTIAELEIDYLSLCLGINIYGRGSFDERSLPGAVHGFIARSREAHPSARMTVMSPIISPPAEAEPNIVGLTLAQVRDIVREVAQSFGSAVTYIDGRDIIGAAEAPAQLSSDELHPHSAGYGFMADRLAPRLAAIFEVPTAHAPLEVTP